MRGDQPKLTSGKWRADWIYVDDVIDGFMAAMLVPEIEGLTIDLGTGQLVSVEAMIQQIVEIMGISVEPQFGALSSRLCEEVRVADVEHARRVLGWQPKISVYEGLKRTIEWHRSSSPISAVMPNAVKRD